MDLVSPLSIMELISHSTLMAKGVLLLLLVFSVTSWAVIFAKFFVYKKAKQEDNRFLNIFSKSQSLNNIYSFSKELKYSPVARVFLTGYQELFLFQKMASDERDKKSGAPMIEGESISESDMKGIRLALNKSINREVDRLYHRLDFLATTGSTTPFIGLFGTVWGIMHAFRMISLKGSASIGGVAPGIAEALIATAAGLVAAIPAVIFYNYLNTRVRVFANRMDDFGKDFMFMTEKNFMK